MSSYSEIIQPPADMRTRKIVENAASFVSKNGLEYDTKMYPGNEKLDFLRSPADPHHAYYKYKLAENIVRNQERAPDDDTVDYDSNVQPCDHLRSLEVFNARPGVRTVTLIERTTLLVSKIGMEFQWMVRTRNADDPRFNFLKMTDPQHGLYLRRLTAYCSKNRGRAKGISVEEHEEAQEADLDQFGAPEGMTFEELDVIKRTARFVVQCGDDVFAELTKRVATNRQFEFIKPTHGSFAFFTQVVAAYSQVLKAPKEEFNEYLRKNPHRLETILEGLFLQTDVYERRRERARIQESQGLPPPGEQKLDDIRVGLQ